MSEGIFLAVFGGPFLLACAGLAWGIATLGRKPDRGWLTLGVALTGWAAITVIMATLSHNLIEYGPTPGGG